jgi:hypothetical protein
MLGAIENSQIVPCRFCMIHRLSVLILKRYPNMAKRFCWMLRISVPVASQ